MNKKFDCVKMKNDIQEQLYRELSPSSVADYFNKLVSSGRQSKLWDDLKKKSKE